MGSFKTQPVFITIINKSQIDLLLIQMVRSISGHMGAYVTKSQESHFCFLLNLPQSSRESRIQSFGLISLSSFISPNFGNDIIPKNYASNLWLLYFWSFFVLLQETDISCIELPGQISTTNTFWHKFTL